MSDREVWERTHENRKWGAYPNEDLVRFVCKNYQQKTPLTALDLGCGQGASSWFLTREGFKTVAFDQSKAAVVKTREGTRLANLFHRRLMPTCGTFLHLPFADKTFDLVVDIVSAAHNSTADIWKIYYEVERVLKPNGRFFALFPTNRCSRRPFVNHGTISFLEKIEVQRLVTQPFTDVRILKASYDLAEDCTVENWVVSGTRKYQE